jgi:hypothetical protein
MVMVVTICVQQEQETFKSWTTVDCLKKNHVQGANYVEDNLYSTIIKYDPQSFGYLLTYKKLNKCSNVRVQRFRSY